MSKRLLEKKRLREEEEAAAHVFQEFISVFQSPPEVPNKLFIKSATLAPGAGKELPESSQIYHPKPNFSPCAASVEKALECARICAPTKYIPKQPKRKSNLESFKDELKSLHAERQSKNQKKTVETAPYACLEPPEPATTNLFITKPTVIYKDDLIRTFGAFGALASVKIMWPRGEDAPIAAHCGFVAFMARKDAERAFKHHENSAEMRVSWAKAIEIPPQPIFVPNSLLERYLPPPATNLPFSAHLIHKNDDFLSETCVKVVIPLDKRSLWTINRMVEFVVREGHHFEALIMQKESNNPEFRFLFDNKSAEHVYYRWRLFSVLNGDDLHCWRMEPFRMFEEGSIWKPPEAVNFKLGMPDDLVHPKTTRITFTHVQYVNIVKIIRELTVLRRDIAKAMMFFIGNLNFLIENIEILLDSLKNTETDALRKLARLFLLSDVLYNLKKVKFPIDFVEILYKDDLVAIFSSFGILKCDFDRHSLELRVTKVLRQWHISRLVSDELIKRLEESFALQTLPKSVPSKWDD